MKINLEIKTGYFANLKKYENAGYLTISIALYPPKWFTGTKVVGLSPSQETFRLYKNSEISDSEFKDLYLKDISDSIPKLESYLKSWEALCNKEDSPYKGVVLLCFENPNAVCHRHFLAEYIGTKYGIPVKEFKFES